MIVKIRICSVLAALLLSLAGCITEKEAPDYSLGPGNPLPHFEVTTLDGTTVSSADSYSAEMVIIFFNTTCGDCRRELPAIQKEYEADCALPEEERALYICISREEGASDVERYWAENHLTLPVSAQSDRKIFNLFASAGIPRIYRAKRGVITSSLYPDSQQ